MRTNISAYTEPGVSSPAYLSINREENGEYSISVREAGQQSPATIMLSAQHAKRVGADLYFEFHNGSGG